MQGLDRNQNFVPGAHVLGELLSCLAACPHPVLTQRVLAWMKGAFSSHKAGS